MVAKPSQANQKLPSGLHPLLARFAERAEEFQAYKAGGTDLDLTVAYQCYLYRLEPSTYTGGAEFLKSFSEVPDENTVRSLFGGGKYQLRIFQNGRIQPGPANFRIAGNPKLVVAEDENAPDEKAVVSGSSDGVLFGILERKIQGLEAKLGDILRSVETTVSGGGDSLSPKRLGQLIDVANAKRLETRLLESSLGASGPSPAQVAPASTPAPSVDMLEMVLKVFRAGVEFAGSSGDGGTDDLVSKGLSHLLDLFGKATGKTVPAPVVEPARVSPAPDVRAEYSPGPEHIEAQRRAVEKDVTERKAADMVERLQRAISVMLDAFSAEAYSIDDVCGFVRGVLSQDEIDRVGDKLTFDNVRQLMAGNPESQIELDSYKNGVESVLARLQAPEGGTSVSNGSG